jgi:hypothetical protein
MFRISVRLGLLAGLAYAVLKVLQQRENGAAPAGAPTWPPVTPPTKRPVAQPTPSAPSTAAPVRQPVIEVVERPQVEPGGEALPPSQPPAQAWVEPSSDGLCPQSHPIRAKLSSKIFHLPGMLAYERTKPDRCYAAEDAAVGDGFRKAKR